MDRNEFAKRLKSIVIQEGTSEELINKMMLPISDALVQMMPSKLFRYRICDKRQIEAFWNDEIYAVTANQFNDLYDTLAKYDINNIKENTKKLMSCEAIAQLKQYLEQDNEFPDSILQTYPKDFLDLFKSQLLSVDCATIGELVDNNRNQILANMDLLFPKLDEMSKKYATIACFCETVQSITMWSHYADFHKGFALEYNLRPTLINGIKNAGVFPVIYDDERFDASLDILCNFIKMMGLNPKRPDITVPLKTVLHKSTQWEYEKEWRLVDYTPREGYFKDYVSIIKQKPTAIYYGQRMSKEDKKFLHGIAIMKQLPEYEMYIDYTSSHYEMQYKPYL